MKKRKEKESDQIEEGANNLWNMCTQTNVFFKHAHTGLWNKICGLNYAYPLGDSTCRDWVKFNLMYKITEKGTWFINTVQYRIKKVCRMYFNKLTDLGGEWASTDQIHDGQSHAQSYQCFHNRQEAETHQDMQQSANKCFMSKKVLIMMLWLGRACLHHQLEVTCCFWAMSAGVSCS